jgi:hypothetical protein
MVSALLVLIVVVAVIAAPGASAEPAGCEYQPLVWSELNPPVGTNFTETESQNTIWAMVAQPGWRYTTVYVASGPLLGSDGRTLSDLDRVDSFVLAESQTNPGLYRSFKGPSNSLRAGKYYWQMEAKTIPIGCTPPQYQSPVYSFEIVPKPAPTPKAPSPPAPPPPPQPTEILTLREAYALVRQDIRRKTHAGAYKLSDRCWKTSSSQAKCKAAWMASPHPSSRTFLYAGTFIVEHGEWSPQLRNNLYATFTGLRAHYGCDKRLGMKRCASHLHWSG